MPDNISGMSDSELLAMAQNLNTTVTATPATYGLTAPFVVSLDAAVSDFDQKLADHIAKQAAAKAQTAAKSASRVVLEEIVRDARQNAKAAKGCP